MLCQSATEAAQYVHLLAALLLVHDLVHDHSLRQQLVVKVVTTNRCSSATYCHRSFPAISSCPKRSVDDYESQPVRYLHVHITHFHRHWGAPASQCNVTVQRALHGRGAAAAAWRSLRDVRRLGTCGGDVTPRHTAARRAPSGEPGLLPSHTRAARANSDGRALALKCIIRLNFSLNLL